MIVLNGDRTFMVFYNLGAEVEAQSGSFCCSFGLIPHPVKLLKYFLLFCIRYSSTQISYFDDGLMLLFNNTAPGTRRAKDLIGYLFWKALTAAESISAQSNSCLVS